MERIYITDLDHTLLDSKAEVPTETLKGIETLNSNNIDFTVASARSVKSIQIILEKTTLKLPVIEFNGAFISDFNTGGHLIVNIIKRDIINEILSITKNMSLEPFYSVFNGEKDQLFLPEISNGGLEWYYNDKVKNKDPRLEDKKYYFNEDGIDSIVCLTYVDSFENLKPLDEYLRNCSFFKDLSVNFYENKYSKGWCWLTIHSSKSQKHLGIKDLLAITNKENHEVIVFGDSINDASMFKVADRSYAVSNADKELKELATEVIGHHEDNAVIDFIIKDAGL